MDGYPSIRNGHVGSRFVGRSYRPTGYFCLGTFAAALTPSLAIGFHWRKATKQAAIASISVGLILNLSLEWISGKTLFPIHYRRAYWPVLLP